MPQERELSKENEEFLSGIPAIILCGGLSTRMKVGTGGTTKMLVEIEPGKPLLSYPLELIENAGVRKVVLCTGYNKERIHKHYGRRFSTLGVEYVEEHIPMGVYGAFRSVVETLQFDTDFFLLHGDEIIENVSLLDMYKFHQTHGGIATNLVSTRVDADKTVIMRLDENGRVTFAKRNPDSGEKNSSLASLGLFLFKPAINRVLDQYSTWEGMVKDLSDKSLLYGYRSEAKFYNINSAEDILKYLSQKNTQK